MKRFVFRLERLRRLRELAKREAQARLARGYAAVRRLREEIEALETRAAQEGSELSEGVATGSLDGDVVRRCGERIAALEEACRRLHTALAVALEDVAALEVEFLERKRDHEVLQKLRARKRRDWIAEIERAEQKQLDEIHRSRRRANHDTRLS